MFFLEPRIRASAAESRRQPDAMSPSTNRERQLPDSVKIVVVGSRWVLPGVALAAVVALTGSAAPAAESGAALAVRAFSAASTVLTGASDSSSEPAFVLAEPAPATPTDPADARAKGTNSATGIPLASGFIAHATDDQHPGADVSSRLVTTVEPLDDNMVSAIAAWITTSRVPIVGALELHQRLDGEWTPIATAMTGRDGTAVVEVDVDVAATAQLRFAYPGGSRFGAVTSEPAAVPGDDVHTIPVTSCSSAAGLDVLPSGVACHYTPVRVGNFVVGHDYLGNSWWNTVPIGSYIELDGKFGGLYEVVDRVMAPGRGSALGSASDWTCGEECDVILQTCRGDNTGFSWLRKISSVE
jgi:hypothetical protein